MSNIQMVLNVSLLRAAIRCSTPILLAALGAVFTQQANILNIGMEGMMLLGAFTAVAVSFTTQSAFLGLLAAICVGILLALVIAVVSLKFKADMTLAGIAINLLGTWVSRLLLKNLFHQVGSFYSPDIVPLPTVNIAFLDKLPLIGEIINRFSILDYVAILLVLITYYAIFRTPWGLRVRAVGIHSLAAETTGINVPVIQYTVLIISGALSGMAGAHLGLGYTTMFSEGMSGGRGFMGVAAMFFGGAMPVKAWFAAILFGFCDALAARLQVFGLPPQFPLMLPYVATVAVLAISMAQAARPRLRKEVSTESGS